MRRLETIPSESKFLRVILDECQDAFTPRDGLPPEREGEQDTDTAFNRISFAEPDELKLDSYGLDLDGVPFL